MKWYLGIEILMPLSLKMIDIQMHSKVLNFFPFPQYWEKAKFPFQVIPKLGALRIAGGTIKVVPASFSFCSPSPPPSLSLSLCSKV